MMYAEYAGKPAMRWSLYLKWGLLLCILIVRGVEISWRTELHPDEVYSVLLAGNNDTYYKSLPQGEYSGDELQQALISHHSLSEDIRQLYIDNHDSPHASLYYMMLRVALQGQTHWDASEIALRGGVLNLLLLSIAYLLMWSLLCLLIKDRKLIFAAMAMAFLSPAAGECVILVREYQLATLCIIWYTYAVLILYHKIAQPHRLRNLLMPTLLTSLACAGAISSGYLNIYYIVLLPLSLSVTLLLSREYMQGIRLAIVSIGYGIVSIAISVGIYTGFFHFITTSNVHTHRAFGSLWGSVWDALSRDIGYEALTPIGTVALLIGVAYMLMVYLHRAKCRETNNSLTDTMEIKPSVAILVTAVIAIVMAQYTSLLSSPRYCYPYMPMLSMAMVLVLAAIGGKIAKIGSIAVSIYFVVTALIWSPVCDFGWERGRHTLAHGATFHNLYPNELALLYPLCTPSATYRIMHRAQYVDGNDSVIVLRHGEEMDNRAPVSLPGFMKAYTIPQTAISVQ